MQAYVLGSGMWAGTMATVILPSTLHCMVPPVLALETLLWVGDIYADTAGDPPYHEVEIDGGIGGSFGL